MWIYCGIWGEWTSEKKGVPRARNPFVNRQQTGSYEAFLRV
jgi:hypothetical protein